ncbi:hypothetical protein AAEH76_22060, partial [Shewanella algae]|uniref:hypothetical protein n=1 Tax=Shewanella algae TaxID=38313 RepID=UPI00313EAF83
TFTVNVAVPAAVGVPLNTTVPATAFAVKFAAVKPVPPATNDVTVNDVYGPVPPRTVIVWLVAVFAVAAANAAGAMLNAGFTVPE